MLRTMQRFSDALSNMRLNDVVNIFLVNDVVNVVSYPLKGTFQVL